jgi:hypothetical protein
MGRPICGDRSDRRADRIQRAAGCDSAWLARAVGIFSSSVRDRIRRRRGGTARISAGGRSWSRGAIALWLALPIAAIVTVTLASWQFSPVVLRGEWWLVWGVCFSRSAATALPVVAIASVLAARAYATRPALAGALLGLGAGLMADAGWRIFCHFSEPSHVLSAHLAAVVLSTAIGSLVSVRLCGRQT